ncbi:MAG: hypothetical protein PWP23_1216 [Candidatus Sumerlaeota bacterium]|nr:hypothetical protein [Candidatus Sumerlaeota bacterium]
MAMALLYLIPGIFSLIWVPIVATLTLSGMAVMLPCAMCTWVFWIVELVAAVGAIIVGAKMLANPPGAPVKWVTVMMIITILDCNIITMTAGILTLVFMANVEVKQYYANRGMNY